MAGRSVLFIRLFTFRNIGKGYFGDRWGSVGQQGSSRTGPSGKGWGQSRLPPPPTPSPPHQEALPAQPLLLGNHRAVALRFAGHRRAAVRLGCVIAPSGTLEIRIIQVDEGLFGELKLPYLPLHVASCRKMGSAPSKEGAPCVPGGTAYASLAHPKVPYHLDLGPGRGVPAGSRAISPAGKKGGRPRPPGPGARPWIQFSKSAGPGEIP
jgi:hypothetical protein